MAESCLNCDATIEGKFCHQCGQRDSDYTVSFWRLAAEAVKESFEVDGRMFRTARVFFTRPGFLVKEYLAGKRVRYSSPLRLFIFAALICFFALKVFGPTLAVDVGEDSVGSDTVAKEIADEAKTADGEAGAGDAGPRLSSDAGVIDSPTESEHSASPSPKIQGLGWIGETIERNVIGLRALPPEEAKERLSDAAFDATPTVLFLMLPFFALALKLLFRRRRYIEHLVLALNIHSVALVLVAFSAVVSFSKISGFFNIAVFILVQLHLIVGLKRVYENSWKRTLAKYLALSLISFILAAFTLAGVMITALLQV